MILADFLIVTLFILLLIIEILFVIIDLSWVDIHVENRLTHLLTLLNHFISPIIHVKYHYLSLINLLIFLKPITINFPDFMTTFIYLITSSDS